MLTIKNMTLNFENQQHIIVALCVALAILTGSTFLYVTWQWHNDWVLTQQEAPAVTVAKADETANLIASIPDAHLFGLSLSNGDVPITNLQLLVTGIVKTEDGQSKAYISIAGAPSKIYQSGDNLPYGVKVYEITRDTVILENDGRLEKLPLPREKLQFKPFNAEER